MGLDVFIDNQLHEREFAGSEAGESLASLMGFAEEGGNLWHIYPHGDTMFHVGQMRQLVTEIQRIKSKHPEASHDADHVLSLLERAIRRRGYLWIQGD